MNNDNDLNLHGMTKLSSWLRHCSKVLVDKPKRKMLCHISFSYDWLSGIKVGLVCDTRQVHPGHVILTDSDP